MHCRLKSILNILVERLREFDYKTSSIFSGNFVPFVSGSNKAKIEAKEQHEPITITGKGFQIDVKISNKNPIMAPSPPKNDPIPTVEFRIGVGNNSDVVK